jgi:hypothetical protein
MIRRWDVIAAPGQPFDGFALMSKFISSFVIFLALTTLGFRNPLSHATAPKTFVLNGDFTFP